MLEIAGYALAAVTIAIVGLTIWRSKDVRADRHLRTVLRATPPADPEPFDPAMLSTLPDPARRFFRFAIEPGTPLRTVAEIEMSGELSMATRDEPNYQPMRARQIIAVPDGFVWEATIGTGIARVQGTDAFGNGTSWSRFRLCGLVPVARAGGGMDHRRSAFGRLIGEGLFWTPAAFLPSDTVTWQAVDDDTASVTIRTEEFEQTVRLTVGEDGRPLRLVFSRWSNENPEKRYRLQPFGGELSEFETFNGFRLPTRVIGGNHFGKDLYHPFFKAKVTQMTFPEKRQ